MDNKNEINKIYVPILDLSNWTVVTKGTYRYTYMGDLCYTLILHNPNWNGPIEKAPANVYFADLSTSCLSYDYILRDKPVAECLKWVADDVRRREINFAWAVTLS